jgi:hypothetical protein
MFQIPPPPIPSGWIILLISYKKKELKGGILSYKEIKEE